MSESVALQERHGAPRDTPGWKGTDRYQVLRSLGAGAMGIVYEAFDRERQQVVALKTLLRFSPVSLYRFKQEFRVLADVQHPNLVALYELVASDPDRVFFSMQLVQGSHFLAHVQAPGRGPESKADIPRLRAALRQLVEGTLALHAAGKIHRDIKPSNVLVTPEGHVVLLDFGLATGLALSGYGTGSPDESGSIGTARYMAPEQATDETLTPACDWYSVGVVLYEALVGAPPFVGSDVDVMTSKNAREALAPSSCVDGVPQDLDSLCCALLRLEPGMRPTGPEILRRLGVLPEERASTVKPSSADISFRGLVGREDHVRALQRAFERTRAGQSLTVRVGGPSGMGKSTLVQHVLDGLVACGQAVVLRGRAYERESLPFKAMDGVVDALSVHLMRLHSEGSLELPPGIGALARLFPVLRRVPGIVDAPSSATADLQEARQKGFGALRDLLKSITERDPLVLYVDDTQWGDNDSAALLLELMRPPHEPHLLLVLTYRDDEAQTSSFWTETQARWPVGAQVEDLEVGPLSPEASRWLALSLLGADDEMAESRARAVARESGGHPFLIEELVRSMDGVDPAGDGSSVEARGLSLEQMLERRVERLPDEAQRLLEVVAVSGRPVPAAIVGQASCLSESMERVTALLRANRFVRARLRDGRDWLETSHDRIRQTVLARLSETALRAHHGRLVRILEATPEADAEALATHLLGAGEDARAALYAERAAEQAAAKLAFDQAARLFGLTLRTQPASSDARRVRKRLAEMLELAGRSQEAGRAYLVAAAGASGVERLTLERAAVEQLLIAGRLDEGELVLRQVLSAVGLRAPRSTPGGVFWLIMYRLWRVLAGLRYGVGAAKAIPAETRLRIDVLFAVSMGYAIVDLVLGACMQARHTVEALRAGDRFQVLRATLLDAVRYSAGGGAERKRERELFEIARTLSTGDPEGTSMFRGLHGMALFLRGRWREAYESLDEVDTSTQGYRTGKSNAHLYALYSLVFCGELREVARRHARMMAEAEQRGDVSMMVGVRAGPAGIAWLAADEPDLARRHARDALAQWPHGRFQIQHLRGMLCEAEIELYAGDGERAHARIMQDARALKRSLMQRIQYSRAFLAFARGRALIAWAQASPERRLTALADARRIAQRLEREGMPWISVLASMVAAGAANAAGNSTDAVSYLQDAIARARATGMGMHAAASLFQLGVLIGGTEGSAMRGRATEAMSAEGVRNPERFANMFLPGRWT